MTRTVYLPAAIGFGAPGVFIVLTEGWGTFFLALATSIALIALLLAARGYQLARQHTAEIFDEELDREPDHKGLDPKDFAMDLRIPPVTRIDDTVTGEDR